MQTLEQPPAPVSLGSLATMNHPQGLAFQDIDGQYAVEGVQTKPFTEKGESLQISSDTMVVGTPYPFFFMEWWFVAVKRADGELDFFYLDG